MRFKELLQKDLSELRSMRGELQVKLEQLTRQLMVRGVKNVREIRALRKDIARIETRITALSSASRA
ncbi:50S ribosomal protein L29 [bacterium]|nr:50S ribosomal protein L29 [bacterium]NBX49568.1 50S ribosomal protein L29 [bacterium]